MGNKKKNSKEKHFIHGIEYCMDVIRKFATIPLEDIPMDFVEDVSNISHTSVIRDKSFKEIEAFVRRYTAFNKESKATYRAYVDGSFNPETGVYGYGVIIKSPSVWVHYSGYGNNPDISSMRNVAGELEGAIAAIQKALELGFPELTLYYDYSGIEKWATGEWKRNKKKTKEYYEFIQAIRNDIDLHFVKVTAHSGDVGNEMADKLAKQAVGIETY